MIEMALWRMAPPSTLPMPPPTIGYFSIRNPNFGTMAFSSDMSFFSTSDNAIINPVVIAYGESGTTKVAVRAFADQIHANVISWNPSAQEVTISAIATDGFRMTVILTVDSSQAVVLDSTLIPRTVDIATFTEGRSGSPGSVRAVSVDGRVFLPVRFLAYVFGFNVYWDDGITIVRP